MPSISEGLIDLNEILDQGFQACFAICEDLPDVFRKHAKGPYEIDKGDVKNLLERVLNRLYDRMARTLFAVLCRMVALRGGPEKINFYFWPGYFSLLLKKRIYFTADVSPIENAERFGKTGIGFCESHRDGIVDIRGLKAYQDCSQARWYHYAWKQKDTWEQKETASHPAAASVYRWFREQRPRVSEEYNEHDLIASLTVTTDGANVPKEDLNDFDTAGNPQRYQFLLLDATERDPTVSSKKVADKMNAALRKNVQQPDIMFPDTPDFSKNPWLARGGDVRLLELGLWMHSVFHDHLPTNLEEIIATIENAGYSQAAEWLKRAKNDPVATKEERSERDRLIFTDWSTISLHPMLSPALLNSTNDEQSPRDDPTERKTIGSAVFLSSTTLGKDFLGLVRYWVRTVYGMIRNSESVVLWHNEMLQTSRRRAMIAGPWFAHEINAILGKNTRLKRNLRSNAEEEVAFRRMVLNTAESVARLAYIATSAVLETNPEQQKKVQAKFCEPLRELQTDQLKDALFAAARVAYNDARANLAKSKENGEIPALEGYPTDSQNTNGVCFLLVNELITNHVRHSRDKSAQFKVEVGEGKAVITLSANGPELSVSKTLEYLDQMLAALGMGGVKREQDRWKCMVVHTTITVQF